MLGLRRWHWALIASEAIAGLMVIWACHDIVDNRYVFLGGLAGRVVLSPGLRLLGWPADPVYPIVCLVTAAIYTVVIFGFWAISRLVISRLLRHLDPPRLPRNKLDDLDRYLR
jgi:hypothetical protein